MTKTTSFSLSPWAGLTLGAWLIGAAAASSAETSPQSSALVQAQVLLTEDQDFERDRACLRNRGPEGLWTSPHQAIGFVIPHGLKNPPLAQDIKVSAPAGLDVRSLEVQSGLVVITLAPGPDGHLFAKEGLTCIDLHGLDYRADLPQGWFNSGTARRAQPPEPGTD